MCRDTKDACAHLVPPDGSKIHRDCTNASGLCYLFYGKHHNPNDQAESQWLGSIDEAAEFSIFDEADERQTSCKNGHLYGVLVRDGRPVQIGTRDQCVATFWAETKGRPWHGFPSWPICGTLHGKRNRRIAPVAAIEKMRDSGWITPRWCKRLVQGRHL